MNEIFMRLYKEKYGKKITREIAEEIVSHMAVTDGSGRTSGEKWTVEEAAGMADKVGASWDVMSQCEWYLVLNAMYSDHYETVHRHGLSDTFYGELAMDWFYDIDGASDKTLNYFIHL